MKITPAGVCEIGFVPSGNSALGVVARITNGKGSFAASCAFILDTAVCVSVFGDGGESFVYFCNVFTKLLLPVCLGGNRKMVALTLDHPVTSDRDFQFPVLLQTVSASFLCFCLMGHALKDGP